MLNPASILNVFSASRGLYGGRAQAEAVAANNRMPIIRAGCSNVRAPVRPIFEPNPFAVDRFVDVPTARFSCCGSTVDLLLR